MADDTTRNESRVAAIVYQRDKKTKRSVILADLIARYGVMVGGMLVIVAVFMIMIFLIYVCLPLLDAASSRIANKFFLAAGEETHLETQIDENQTIAADLLASGEIRAFHVGTGTPVQAPAFALEGKQATAFASTLRGDDVLFGFADGSIQTGKFALNVRVLTEKQMPKSLRRLNARDVTDGASVYSRIPGQYRQTLVESSLDPAVQISEPGTPILFADYRVGGAAERPTKTFVTLDGRGVLRISQAFTELNMLTGVAAVQIINAEMLLSAAIGDVRKLLLNAQGDRVFVALANGTLFRFLTRDFNNPKLAETVKVLPQGVQLASIAYQNGENSLIIGGSDGSVAIWFGVDRKSKATIDGVVLTKAHGGFENHQRAVTAIRVSQRTRLFATTDESGEIWIRHGTTERTLLKLKDTPDPQGLLAVSLAPKDDGVLGVGRNGNAVLWSLQIPHPETTLQSLFGKVWYEGYSEPEYVWQSTAGTDAPEPKLSLIPLIFGTIKAAVYSLLLAIPIALLGAIYTSEFLPPSSRAVVKPVMELMASLPSVVVGFIAALVLSPIVENWIAAVVIAFALLPLTVISVAFLWQLLPQSTSNALDGLPKLIAYAVAVLTALWTSASIGPWVEFTFFGGDFQKWSGGEGSGQPFLFLLLIPIALVFVIVATRPLFNAAYRLRLREMSRTAAAFRDLVGWLAILSLALIAAYAASAVLQQLGYDIRGGFVDTYVQRNALIVAFALAFTQIPLIYSIAEDSLSAVPNYLRTGAFACGASRWQTANWIVIPTAASGIFAAVMIGLGRAVGETMIVVMVTGNTPILDVNIFNGLRTLSANINVELPEAVRDSTLYRALFLCAFVLFVMTFAINTVAEVVRQQYRKRTAQL